MPRHSHRPGSEPFVAGEILQLEVEKPVAGGRMLARFGGFVVLVAGAIPGERISARVERRSKGLAYAQTVQVEQPSPDRRPAGDARCGGQALAHVAYPRQLRLKSEIIQDAFGRIGRIPLTPAPPLAASPETGYRMRCRLHVRDGRIGFFREGSYDICDAAGTGQLSEGTAAWIAHAQRLLAAHRLTHLVSIEIAESIDGGQRAGHLELADRSAVAAYEVLAAGLTGLSVSAGARARPSTLAGSPAIIDALRAGDGGAVFTLERDVRAFFQGNRFLLHPLVSHVLAALERDSVLDLYAGVGLFGLAAAAAGAAHVDLVESDPISGRSLERNLRAFSGRAAGSTMPVERFLASQTSLRGRSVIVDPPRTGLSRAVLHDLTRTRPDRIVYVSCDPATLARDLRVLLDGSYGLEHVSGFDLFPNTAHIETVAVLTRIGI